MITYLLFVESKFFFSNIWRIYCQRHTSLLTNRTFQCFWLSESFIIILLIIFWFRFCLAGYLKHVLGEYMLMKNKRKKCQFSLFWWICAPLTNLVQLPLLSLFSYSINCSTVYWTDNYSYSIMLNTCLYYWFLLWVQMTRNYSKKYPLLKVFVSSS